ncbi:MAG: hypothetical protein AAB972_04045, partial [Patescibacteria group bacterium]
MRKESGFVPIIAIIIITLVVGAAGVGGFLTFQDKTTFISQEIVPEKSVIVNEDAIVAPAIQSQDSKFIQADFIDLSYINAISKFRSGSGHDFSQGSGETCRSMKHYFNVRRTPEVEQLISHNKGIPPAPDGKTDISIYSPVDGKIISIESEQMPIGKQIYIRPDSRPDFIVRLFHIYPLSDIKKGVRVKAGQKIGVIGQYQNTDIAIMRGRKHLSYFEVMPDTIFAKYQALGIKSRKDLIIFKEERDANPLECNGEWFSKNYDGDPGFGNFVYLNSRTSPVSQGAKEMPKPQIKSSPVPTQAPPSPTPPPPPPPLPVSVASKNLIYNQDGISFEYYWPGEAGLTRLSTGETEVWVFNRSKSPVTISEVSFTFWLKDSVVSLASGTWEKS